MLMLLIGAGWMLKMMLDLDLSWLLGPDLGWLLDLHWALVGPWLGPAWALVPCCPTTFLWLPSPPSAPQWPLPTPRGAARGSGSTRRRFGRGCVRQR